MDSAGRDHPDWGPVMPKLVELPDGRVIEFPDNMTDEQINTNLRLSLAGEQSVSQATAGAQARNTARSPEQILSEQMGRMGSFGPAPTQEDIAAGRRENIGGLTTAAMAAPLVPAMISGAIAAPVATAKAIGGGLLGSAIGNEGGRWVGRNVPVVGGEGMAELLGGIGGFAGGVGGGIAGPKLNVRDLLSVLPGGGRGGLLQAVLGGAEKQAAKTATGAASNVADDAVKALRAKEIEQRIAIRAEKAARDAERHAAYMENMRKRLEGKPVPRAPKASKPTSQSPAPTKEATAVEPEVLPDDAVAAIVEPIPEPTILQAGQRAMATNLGGSARPGPVATPAVDLEDVLRRSVEAAKAAKAAKAAGGVAESPLRKPRLEVGAQRVGKGVGMTKEEVRLATGPRLDETLGEASPILPDVPLQKIIDTMKALPKTGGAREAYVARATSGKTKWQVENIRRTLEHLGLLAPVAVAGGLASAER